MKKVFVVFFVAGCISLINGINNANAVQSDTTVITYTCPEGCSIIYRGVGGNSWESMAATCIDLFGGSCGDPVVNVVVEPDNAVAPVKPNISNVSAGINAAPKVKKIKPVSARAGKIGPRVAPKTVNITDPINEKPEITDKVSSGWTWLVCQEGCKPRCVETAAGGVYCDCRNGDGGLCEDAISTSGPDNSLR